MRRTAVMAAHETQALFGNDQWPNTDTLFGANVFGFDAMRKRLPSAVYRELERTIEDGERLNPAIADVIANAMKDWALEQGATHYTHWFQPMTGLTAEKHDAFLTPTQKGHVLSEFSGRMLISGEPDASSFPSGGIRSTFEARGYTAWDPTVPAFIIDQPYAKTLHIPSYFYSYSGEALDRKIPLQRSIQALSTQALRILRFFGNTEARSVQAMVGPEQEYFLVDSHLAALRPDLLLCGRTLLGRNASRGQEMADQYFGAIPERVLSFMQDLEHHLLLLGVPCKTRHNEVAPGQFELAPVYEDANTACDHNMLTMNMMRHLAPKHGFLCLLHEKPFAGVNGSGKHNNWSLKDSEGNNLLNPGKTPQDNAQFLVFLAAVLAAVHKHSTVLRLGTIGAGNDHRLGANEAPPAILSVYLGSQMTEVIEHIIHAEETENKGSRTLEIGVSTLPPLPLDMSDRNRTSPFAFTGNKFEFRAVGSSQSIAPANIALNAAVACTLKDIADDLEKRLADGQSRTQALQEMLPELFREHMPVVFNGNGYTEEWVEEAARRNLPNHTSTVDALSHYSDREVMAVFTETGILNEREILARQEILFENYATTRSIEGSVLADILRTQILPVARENAARAAEEWRSVQAVLGDTEASHAKKHCQILNTSIRSLTSAVDSLEAALNAVKEALGAKEKAQCAKEKLLPCMAVCREHADSLEKICDDASWQLPKYSELLWIH
ncbi:MAG: glutamine synthetase III [Desulfovibrionaceae bacterium]|nr:glutamine synthetase III [Desulfovibrionaceae bacterium]